MEEQCADGRGGGGGKRDGEETSGEEATQPQLRSSTRWVEHEEEDFHHALLTALSPGWYEATEYWVHPPQHQQSVVPETWCCSENGAWTKHHSPAWKRKSHDDIPCATGKEEKSVLLPQSKGHLLEATSSYPRKSISRNHKGPPNPYGQLIPNHKMVTD